ncbi:hypothetical protein YC2023_033610 [Brassica napus]
MNITKLTVVVFIAALCDNVGASRPRGMHNDTKLKDQKLQLEDIIGNIIGNITDPIIGIIGNNTRPIYTPIPTLPNNTSPAPSPDGGSVEIVPSLAPQGEATNGTKAPLSGGDIGVPSLAPEREASNSTEAPLNGGIIGVAPSPLSGGTVGVVPSPIQEGGAINGTEPPLSGAIIAPLRSPIVTEPPLSVDAIGVSPSLPPIGGGTEPTLSGDAIGVAPSLLPIGGGTEPPLSGGLSGGGVIGVVCNIPSSGVVEGWVTYREVIRDSVRVRPKHGKRSGGDCRVSKQ